MLLVLCFELFNTFQTFEMPCKIHQFRIFAPTYDRDDVCMAQKTTVRQETIANIYIYIYIYTYTNIQGVSFEQERWFSIRSYPVKHEVLSGETLFH